MWGKKLRKSGRQQAPGVRYLMTPDIMPAMKWMNAHAAIGAERCLLVAMMVHIPAQIVAECCRKNIAGIALGHRRVVLKAVAANVLHQPLQTRHANNGATTKRAQGIGCELAIANVCLDRAMPIIGRHTPKTHRSGWHMSIQCAISVFIAQG